jgi:hypothetical protein
MARHPECYASPDLFEIGLGEVIVCRFKNDGRVEAGIFLLDLYCLGVKNAFHKIFATEEEFLEQLRIHGLENAPARAGAWGRKLVEGAVEYAKSLGISPHPDYKKGARVFGGIDASECEEEFAYGHNGRPLFVQGPDDDPETCERILTTLRLRVGEDGFDYETASEGEPDMLIAMDSGCQGGEAHPELLRFAREFLDEHPGRYAGVVQGESVDTELAANLLEAAREFAENAETEGEVSINDALSSLIKAWNLYTVPPEERERVFQNLPDRERSLMAESAVRLPVQEEALVILDYRLLSEDQPGQARLLLMALPLSDFHPEADELPTAFPSPGQ